MTPTLRTVKRLADRLTVTRYTFEVAIVKAHQEGASLRQIAAVAGVSYQTIANIVKGNEK